MLHRANMIGRRPRAVVRLLIVPALLAAAAVVCAGELERLPVLKIAPSALFGSGGQAGDPAAQQLRLERLQENFHDVHALLQGRHVSMRSRAELAARGMVPRAPGAADKLVTAETLRVLLVRIGFETDRSGELTSVTTTGDFQLEPIEGERIDPAPHDRAFYESHLSGLSEYYRSQSGGRLIIDGRVLPDGANDSYKLSDLADYGPGAGGGWTLEMLERLVQDIILEADRATQADHSVNLADYGDGHPLTYVIFVHAGADWQSDIYRDSPNDVPTFFVTLGEPVPLVGGSLSECSIIPETTSQDGWLGSVAGALYHEFGHALGLPDVYDTTTGLPAVGLWDLMDSGPNLIANVGLYHETIPDSIEVFSVAGLLPPSLGAWHKWFLGWLDTAFAPGAPAEIRLPAVQVPRSDYSRWYGGAAYDFESGYPQALIGGVSSEEFFLVENRWVPESASELPDATGIGFVRDPDTRVFLYMGGDEVDPDGPGPLPAESRNTGMYDYFLPDGGLLVWHVNQARIRERLPENTINGSGDGLRLLEADGIQDVGVYEAYVFGFYGSYRDPFSAATSTALYGEGRPSSRAFDRSWTGFEMTDISAKGATMRCTAGVAPLSAGGRLELPGDLTAQRPRTLDAATLTPWRMVANGVETEVLVGCAPGLAPTDDAAAEPPLLFVLDHDGGAVLNTPAGLPAGAAVVLDAPLAGPPDVVRYPADGRRRLVAGTRAGTVAAWMDISVSGTWIPTFSATAGDTLTFAPQALLDPDGEVRILCGVESSHVVLLDGAGTELARVQLQGPAGGPAGPVVGTPRLIRTTARGPVLAVPTAAHCFLVPVDAEAMAGITRLDLGVTPVDGVLRTATFTGPAGAAHLLLVGDAVEEWIFDDAALQPPVARLWRDALRGMPQDDPAVADLDGDGRLDLVFVTDFGLEAFASNGVTLTGYPLELAGEFPLAPEVRLDGSIVVFDADGDRRNEVFAVTDHGHLFGWDARGRRLAGLPQRLGCAGRHALVLADDGADAERVLWLAASGGAGADGLGDTQVDGACVAWLPASRIAAADGTAEWRAPGGGVAREGGGGQLRDLGAVSTVTAEVDHFFAYPNPASGDDVVFRYFGAAGGTVRLTVYNLEGEIVGSLVHEGTGGAIEEIPWRLDGLASGVYLCRLTTPTAAGAETRILRLAVER